MMRLSVIVSMSGVFGVNSLMWVVSVLYFL